MFWFSKEGIVAGVPEEIMASHKEKQKKMVCEKGRGSSIHGEALVKRKLTGRLTVDI